jgi:hypothetical protein
VALLWIDGKPIPSARNIAFVAHTFVDDDPDTRRPRLLSSVLEDDRQDGTDDRYAPRRVQVYLTDGPRMLLGLSCKYGTPNRRLSYRGMFFELHHQPSPQRELIRRGTEVALAIDGLVVLDPFVEGSLERLPEPEHGPWSSTLLRLRLAPDRIPSRWLSSLCQPRPARRLVVRLDGQSWLLEELGTLRAWMIATTGLQAWKGPPPGGVELEFVFESQPPVALARAHDLEQLPVKLDAIYDPTTDPRCREQLLEHTRTLLPRVGDVWGKRTRRWLSEPFPQDPEGWSKRIGHVPPRDTKHIEVVAFASDASTDLASVSASLREGAELWRRRVQQNLPHLDEISTRVTNLHEALPTLEAHEQAAGVRAPQGERIALAVQRAHGDPLIRSVAELLDREGLDHHEAWAVYADHLQRLGDPRGEVLALLGLGHDPSSLDPAIIATLDPCELQLRETGPGGCLRFGEREWSPRVWATWVGPMVVQLAVEPGWTRVVDDDGLYTEKRTSGSASKVDHHFFRRELQHRGQSFGLRGWNFLPGYDPHADLECLLELPCCALLSPRRILKAWYEAEGRFTVDMSGADLRGIEILGVHLKTCNFRNANLTGSTFKSMNMVGCDLRDVDLRDAVIDQVTIESCDVRGANWREAKTLRVIRSTDVTADPEFAAWLAQNQPPKLPIMANPAPVRPPR